MITLRPDQEVVYAQLRERASRRRRPVAAAACGWGKGILFAKMVEEAVKRNKRVIFLINNTTILRDFSKNRLDRLGIDHGIIQANHPRCKPWLNTQVAMIQTLCRRERVPPADLVLIDECQFATSRTWRSVIEKYKGATIIGASATPMGPGGIGLGEVFDDLVFGPSTRELIEMGLLVPMRVFAPEPPDTSHVDMTGGDLNQKQLAEVFDKPKLVGDCVEHWFKWARGLRTVGFSPGIEHSKHLRDQFIAAGVNAIHVDAKTPPEVRDAAWEDLASGKLTMVWNVGITTYGWDVKQVECAILELRSESVTKIRQMFGRVQRPAPGKKSCILIDHGGNVYQPDMWPGADPEWSLEGNAGARGGKPTDPALSIRMCANCWAAYPSSDPKCPLCGAVHEVRRSEIKTVAGELQEITESPAASKAYVIKQLSRDPIMAHFQKEAEAKGYSHRWAWVQADKARKGEIYVDREVFSKWQAFERGRRGAA